MVDRNFIGKGWAFPIRFDSRSGGVKRDTGQGVEQQRNRVRQAINIRLRIQRGELYFARRFGSRLRRLLFALNTANIEQRLRFEALAALEDPEYGERRAFIETLDVQPQNRLDNNPAATIRVDFVLQGSQAEGSLVFPFYLRESERVAAERRLSE